MIFTHELDAQIFDNEEIESCLVRLAKENKSFTVRILIHDSSKAIQRGHRIIRLAQRLTSTIHIRTPSKEYEHEQRAFILADSYGYIHQSIANQSNYRAACCFKAPQKVKELTDYFNEIWEHAEPDSHVRRLFV